MFLSLSMLRLARLESRAVKPSVVGARTQPAGSNRESAVSAKIDDVVVNCRYGIWRKPML